MIDSYLGNTSCMVERETELSMLGAVYWQVQAKREIEDAIAEAKGDENVSSQDSWVRKILLEQQQMRYGRRWRRNPRYRRPRERRGRWCDYDSLD